MMPTKPRRYITHVMNGSDYDPDDPDFIKQKSKIGQFQERYQNWKKLLILH